MIRVVPKPEPATFDVKVRQPGRAFLARVPNPTNKDFKNNAFWKYSAKELHAAYSGVCAYSCFYQVRLGTTDHFLPKSTHRIEAYEWSNYRLSAGRMNLYKGDSTEAIDPFLVEPGWFVMDVPSCLVRPGPNLPETVRDAVEATIRVLHLNDDDELVQERCNLMVDYAGGHVGLPFLTSRYPFLALEITRQALQRTAAAIFKGRARVP